MYQHARPLHTGGDDSDDGSDSDSDTDGSGSIVSTDDEHAATAPTRPNEFKIGATVEWCIIGYPVHAWGVGA